MVSTPNTATTAYEPANGSGCIMSALHAAMAGPQTAATTPPVSTAEMARGLSGAGAASAAASR
ncbi:hypothetical protein D3C85_1933920 [compost metagenome]